MDGLFGPRKPAPKTPADPPTRERESFDLAKDFFVKGMAAQERGDVRQALRLYTCGVEALDLGLQADCSDAALEAAMRQSREQFGHHIATLTEEVERQKKQADSCPVPKPSASRAAPPTPGSGANAGAATEGNSFMKRLFGGSNTSPAAKAFQVGSTVEAVGLVQDTALCGAVGVVAGYQDPGLVVVDFDPPHGRVALKPQHLKSKPKQQPKPQATAVRPSPQVHAAGGGGGGGAATAASRNSVHQANRADSLRGSAGSGGGYSSNRSTVAQPPQPSRTPAANRGSGSVRPSPPAPAAAAAGGPPAKRIVAAEMTKKYGEKYVSDILDNVVEPGSMQTPWDSITGLEESKQHLMEAVVYPMRRPDLFNGLRSPPRGVLLFGPPGNGKTLLAKAVASESNATFFSISASSLVSKYVGDGERLVKALFGCAEACAPSVVFIDEVDSLLQARGEEHDAMRRLKTEVLVQMDGVGTDKAGDKHVLVLAATNRPADIDTACLRRFTKRLLIPLPGPAARLDHIKKLLKSSEVQFKLSDSGLQGIAKMTNAYSFSDLTALAREAAMIPIRDLGSSALGAAAKDIRPVTGKDFERACEVCYTVTRKGHMNGHTRTQYQVVRPSATAAEVASLQSWAKQYGSTG